MLWVPGLWNPGSETGGRRTEGGGFCVGEPSLTGLKLEGMAGKVAKRDVGREVKKCLVRNRGKDPW